MRGLLSFQILWELGKKPMNGQQLAEEIGKRRGSRPTPGTIYPALKALTRRKLILGDRTGRQVVYRLTGAGERGLGEATRYFSRAFRDILVERSARIR